MGNSWDQEEEVEIGMWSNSQQDNRSHDQNTWNYKHKGSNKVCSPSLWAFVRPKNIDTNVVTFKQSAPFLQKLIILFVCHVSDEQTSLQTG